MKGGQICTIDADDIGDDVPVEEKWFKQKETRGTLSQEVNKAPTHGFPAQSLT
jgi:hypothetical protein